MELSQERIATAVRRATQIRGGRADVNCPHFCREFETQLNHLAGEDTLRRMERSGQIGVVGVADDGDLIWAMV